MNENNRFVLAIDFDGTIVNHKYPEIGELKPGAKKVINELYAQGHTIIIWTCRCNKNLTKDDLTAAKNFLDSEGIKYHKINENADCVGYGCTPKIYADYYIDDRNLFGSINWQAIYEKITLLRWGKYE